MTTSKKGLRASKTSYSAFGIINSLASDVSVDTKQLLAPWLAHDFLARTSPLLELGAAVAGRTRSAPITFAVRRAFLCSGCWTTGAGPVADSTVRAPRG